MDTGTKQITQLADIKVPMDGGPIANLEMIHSQVPLADLKASLYRKPRKGRPQQLFQRDTIGLRQPIRDEIFDFILIIRKSCRMKKANRFVSIPSGR